MSAKTELSAERLRRAEEEKRAAEELAREVAYYQAIALREMRAPGTLLFRIPLARTAARGER